MNAAAVAAENIRLRKIVRSSIGAGTRLSISTNSGSRIAPAISEPSVSGSLQPEMPPRETPSTSPVSPTTNTAVPRRS